MLVDGYCVQKETSKFVFCMCHLKVYGFVLHFEFILSLLWNDTGILRNCLLWIIRWSILLLGNYLQLDCLEKFPMSFDSCNILDSFRQDRLRKFSKLLFFQRFTHNFSLRQRGNIFYYLRFFNPVCFQSTKRPLVLPSCHIIIIENVLICTDDQTSVNVLHYKLLVQIYYNFPPPMNRDFGNTIENMWLIFINSFCNWASARLLHKLG